jgi:hypothetical protein
VDFEQCLDGRGPGGIAQVKANGLIAAAFEHWDSRVSDPS